MWKFRHRYGLSEAIERVREWDDVSMADLQGRGRRQALSATRHVFWRLLRDGGWTLEEIADWCDRDHSTILYGLRRVNLWASEDSEFRQWLADSPAQCRRRAAERRDPEGVSSDSC